MFEFRLPDLGEGIHEGELLKWHVKLGDKVIEDDPLCDMETDKAAVTIPSPRTGVIMKLNANPGDTIHVGEILVEINETTDVSTAATPAKAREKALEKPPVKKADSDSSRVAGLESPKSRVVAAPATRRLAREMNIDIHAINGTGPGGRITKEDLLHFNPETKPDSLPTIDTASEPMPHSGVTPDAQDISMGIPFLKITPLPDYEAEGTVEKTPIRSLRKKIAIKTTSSMILVPHVAHMEECDITDLEGMRKTFNTDHPNREKLTLLSFVIKAISSLLKTYPEFNASLDLHRMEIIYKKFYHIGFAAATPRGLIVPVIKNADQKSVVKIARDLKSLSKKGQDASISLSELTGGTFSVTNVGAIGGTGMVPTINYPETAILGMGRVQKKPVVKEEAVVIREILPITLCFDHRVADGAQAAHFVKELKLMLENTLMFMTLI